MYSYKSALCLSRNANSSWKEVDVSQKTLADLFLDYARTIITVYSTALEKDLFVDTEQFRANVAGSTLTVVEALESIEDMTLETLPKLPDIKTKYMRYSDARQAGYKVNTARAGYHDPDNYPSSDQDDLIIRHGEGRVDSEVLAEHCLFTVNGLYHRSTYHGDSAYILEGNRSGQISGRNHVGIHSFYDISKVDQVAIDPSTLRTRDSLIPIHEKLHFALPVDMTGKSFFLVLGGYIVPQERGIFYENGSGEMTLHLSKLPYLERLMESRGLIDLSSLDLVKTEIGENVIHEPTALSEETIRKYFGLSQTFLVVLDIENLSFEKTAIRHRSYPGGFETMSEPTSPLMVGHGRFAEYVKIPTGDRWNISVDDSYLRNYLAPAVRNQVREHINDNVHPNVPTYINHGFLWNVIGYKSSI